jgi:hypothetical protein
MLKRTSKKRTKKLKDINLLAKTIVDEAIKVLPTRVSHKKNLAAITLGKLGGLKGGKARAAKLTKEQRVEIASKAARVRWSKAR